MGRIWAKKWHPHPRSARSPDRNKFAKTKMDFSDLPTELLHMVFETIGPRHVTLAMVLVATEWRTACKALLRRAGRRLRTRVGDITTSISLLKWACANGYRMSARTCESIAMYGHLEVLQWARQQGCPWNESTCAYAAENGHLEVLQWARQQGCPCNV